MNIKLLTNDKKLGDAKNAKKCLPRKSFIQEKCFPRLFSVFQKWTKINVQN